MQVEEKTGLTENIMAFAFFWQRECSNLEMLQAKCRATVYHRIALPETLKEEYG
ncbi:hypothetical protein FQR65_LT10618 [Abscondita terminalis]|nr:hypothetical protein FQR65_LT10618 [Abscondita terminalis]